MLSEYLDAQLPEDLCRELDSHIAGCAPCVEFVESLKKTIALCHAYKAQDAPGPLPPDTRARLLEAYARMLAARKPGGA